MRIGEINNLTVLRKSDLGYMLADETNEEVLLHFKEAKGEYNSGDKVKVFIYYDKKHRLCATENEPFVTISRPGFVSVVEKITSTGVFISNNTGKDVLISTDYLPYDYALWPNVGDIIPVSLKLKKDTIVAKLLNRVDLVDYANDKKYEIGQVVEAYVIRVGEAGVSLATKDYKSIFVHHSMLRTKLRIGENVNVKIVYVKNDNEYNGSLINQKEDQIDPDKEYLLNYLKAHNDQMPLDAKSSSEDVEKILNMSRKAFKRALGGLYKDEAVYFKDNKTFLLKK